MKTKKGKGKGKIMDAARHNESIIIPEIRLKRGDVVVEGKRAFTAEAPTRLDKLLDRGTITDLQHLYGIQLMELFFRAGRPPVRAIDLSQWGVRQSCQHESMILDRMTAEDQYFKLMALLPRRACEVLYYVCLEELSATDAAVRLNVHPKFVQQRVPDALDELGEAFAKMRDYKKELESRDPKCYEYSHSE